MPPLTSDRVTEQKLGDVHHGPVEAGVVIYAGALLVRNAAGNIAPGTAATDLVGVGRAAERVDNGGGAAGAEVVRYQGGIYRYANSAGADEITAVDVGKTCFVVDDQTVAKTDGGAARSPAGIVHQVDSQGVWVRFDEALTRAS